MWLAVFADDSLLEIRTNSEESEEDFDHDDGQMYVTFKIGRFTYPSPRTVLHEIAHAADNHAGRLYDNTDWNNRYTKVTGKAEQVIKDVKQKITDQTAYEMDQYIEKLRKWKGWFNNQEKLDNALNEYNKAVEYISSVIAEYNVPQYSGEELMTASEIQESIWNRVYGEGDPSDFQYMDILEKVIGDFRNRRNALITDHPELSKVSWKKLYWDLISDVYGGVTNNEIVDGSGHYIDLPKTKLIEDESTLLELEADNYWYLIKEKEHRVDPHETHMTAEPWAEYASCRLRNVDGTVEMMDAFLPSYDVLQTEEEMYQILMDYYDSLAR